MVPAGHRTAELFLAEQCSVLFGSDVIHANWRSVVVTAGPNGATCSVIAVILAMWRELGLPDEELSDYLWDELATSGPGPIVSWIYEQARMRGLDTCIKAIHCVDESCLRHRMRLIDKLHIPVTKDVMSRMQLPSCGKGDTEAQERNKNVAEYIQKRAIKLHHCATRWQLGSQKKAVFKSSVHGNLDHEIQALQDLKIVPDHKNIMKAIRWSSSLQIIAYPHGGSDLFYIIRNRTLHGVGEVADVSHQMHSAMKHLHSYGIVHRDVRIENWVVDVQRTSSACSITVQLIDFEYSKSTSNEDSDQLQVNKKQWVSCGNWGNYGYVSPKYFALFIRKGKICHHDDYLANHIPLEDLFRNDLFGLGMCIAAVLTERTMQKDVTYGGCGREKCPCQGFSSWPKKGDRFDLVCDDVVGKRFRTVGVAAIQDIVNAHLTVPEKF